MFGERQVRTLADEIDRLTDGKLASFNVGGDLGQGTRYFDYQNDKIWIGRNASREAATYFLGILAGLVKHLNEYGDGGYTMPDHVEEAAYGIGHAFDGCKSRAEGERVAQRWISRGNRPHVRPFTYEELREIHGLSPAQALLLTESVDRFADSHHPVVGHAGTRRVLISKRLAQVVTWRDANSREHRRVELTTKGVELARELIRRRTAEA